MCTSFMKSHGVSLLIIGIAIVLTNSAVAQTDETILVNSKCESRNLTVTAGNTSSGDVIFRYKGNASGIPVGLNRDNTRTISKINDYFKTSASTGDEAVAAVCNGTTLFDQITAFLYSCPGSPVGFGYPIDCSRITTNSSMIQAAVGGSVSLPDGTRLDVPPGALAADTEISLFGVPRDLVQDPSVLAMIEIAPDGLQLQSNATLTLNYDPSLITSSDIALAYSYHRSAPPLDFGSELSITEPLGIVASNQTIGTLSASVTHFSGFFATISANAELVTEIPLQFLKKSDILVQVSNCGTECDFVPGHTAMYMGTTDPLAPATDGSTIIEAGGTLGSVQLSPPTSFGSGSGTTFSFNKDYMGARTPDNHVLTDSDRTAIAQFATSEIGLPYGVIGSFTGSGETCSGLVAKSYFSAGVPLGAPLTLLEAAATTPLGIMEDTNPVQNVTVKVDTTVNIPVKTMVGVLTSFPFGGILGDGRSYQRNPAGTNIQVASTTPLPSGASFTNNTVGGETFSWTPNTSDIGKTFPIQFTATGPFLGTISNQLNISVAPKCDLSNPTVASITPLTDALTVRDGPTIAPRTGGGWTVIYSDGSLQRVDVDGNGNVVGSQQLTNGSFPSGLTQTNPSLSDDGAVLSFQQTTSTTSGILVLLESDLLEMSPSGGGQTLIQAGGGSTFFFAPDGNLSGGPEVFSACLPNGSFEDNIIGVTTFPLGPVTSVQTLDSGVCDNAQFARPHWDQPRSRIAFGNGGNQVWVIGAGGGGGQVTTGENPDWSPDGQWLVFDDAGNITISTPGGSNRKTLASGTSPAWSSDGCAISYVSNFKQIQLIQLQ